MKRNILATAIACLLLSSCATPAQPDLAVTVDKAGAAPTISEREVNDARLAAIATAALERDMREKERTHAAERSDLMQKLQEMGSELAELKGRLLARKGASQIPVTGTPSAPAASPQLSPAAAAAAAAGVPVARSGHVSGNVRGNKFAMAAANAAGKVPPVAAYSRTSRETIVIQDKGMIFRVMHGFAKTDFHPSKSLQQQLLQAARAGKQIEIRGRTDATTNNDIDRDIAMRRALSARVFLANNGIHPRKMRINYLAAGDNIADNSTPDGRARNRRVEIETAGITPDVLEDMAAVIRQDLQ